MDFKLGEASSLQIAPIYSQTVHDCSHAFTPSPPHSQQVLEQTSCSPQSGWSACFTFSPTAPGFPIPPAGPWGPSAPGGPEGPLGPGGPGGP